MNFPFRQVVSYQLVVTTLSVCEVFVDRFNERFHGVMRVIR